MNGWAVAGALLMHLVAALLLIFDGPAAIPPPPPRLAEPVAVTLLELGEETIAATGVATNPQPPQGLPEPAPPQPVTQKAEKAQPKAPKAPIAPKPEPKRSKPATDEFSAMLNSLSGFRTASRVTPALPGLGANNDDPSLGNRGIVQIKDIIRAQIWRRWEFDVTAMGSAAVVVTLHLVLRPNREISLAEIINDPGRLSNPLYKPVADSLRRAALLSSPFQLPPGTDPELYRDITLSFNSQEAGR